MLSGPFAAKPVSLTSTGRRPFMISAIPFPALLFRRPRFAQEFFARSLVRGRERDPVGFRNSVRGLTGGLGWSLDTFALP
jgi:hypothetical protein